VVVDGSGPRELNPYFCQSYTDPVTGWLRFDGYGIKSVLQFVDDVHLVRSGAVELAALTAVRPTFDQCLVSTAVVEAVATSLRQGSVAVEVLL
jgi:hypothetical protein